MAGGDQVRAAEPLRPAHDGNDALVDLHLSGCIAQRKERPCKNRSSSPGRSGKEDDKARLMFEREWFNDFLDLALDSHLFRAFVDPVRRHHQRERRNVAYGRRTGALQARRTRYGVITREAGDDWKNGISYREGDIACGASRSGKLETSACCLNAPQSLSKKNMLAYWDTFGEVFGMPIRIGKTMSQDTKDIARIETMLAEMGAASWGCSRRAPRSKSRRPAGATHTTCTTNGSTDATRNFQRHTRATMTIDNGSSLSQSETHLEVFENICRAGRHDDKVPRERPTYPADDPARVPLAGVTSTGTRRRATPRQSSARSNACSCRSATSTRIICRQVQNPDHRG